MDRGAILDGRITQLHRDENWYHLGIAFTELLAREGRADISGRQNALFAAPGWRELRLSSTLDRVERGFRRKGPPGAGQIALPADKPLNLKPGFRFMVRSRLVQSGK